MAKTAPPLEKKSVRKVLFAKMPELEAMLNKHGVALAYLFGSQTKEQTTLLSDIDIGVLFAEEVPATEYSDRQIKLITEFMNFFSRNDIDVVVLNACPPLVGYNASKGYLFYKSSEKKRVQFETEIRRQCFDTQRIREVQNKFLTERYLGKLAKQPLGGGKHG